MFIFFLFERKNKENEPKERKTKIPEGRHCQGQAPEPSLFSMIESYSFSGTRDKKFNTE